MAKVQVSSYTRKDKSKRPSTHAKSKISRLKSSKNYKKKYRGQGH